MFVKREHIGFPGVGDHRMLYIDMMQSTWETLCALYSEKVGQTSDNKVRMSNAIGSRITAYYRRNRVMPMEGRR